MNKCNCGFRIGHPEFSKCICNITKPLSDEEILEVIKNESWRGLDGYLIKFARAIEERHGIK